MLSKTSLPPKLLRHRNNFYATENNSLSPFTMANGTLQHVGPPGQKALRLEFLSHLTRGAALVLSFLTSSTSRSAIHWLESILLCYVFSLGVARTVFPSCKGAWRTRLLHLINVLLTVIWLIALGRDALPLIFVSVDPILPKLIVWKLVFISACVTLSFITPREWNQPLIAFELAHRLPNDGPNPEETCSWFSYYVSYAWLTGTVIRGWQGKLDYENLLHLPHYDEPLLWLDRVLELRKQYGSTFFTMLNVMSAELIRMAASSAIMAFSEFLAPIAMFRLLSYLRSPESAEIRPIFWVMLLFLGPMLRSVAYQQYLFTSTRFVVRIKMCLIQELYSKALRAASFEDTLSHKHSRINGTTENNLFDIKPVENNMTRQEKNPANLISMITYDIENLCASRDLLLVIIAAPIEVTIAMFFLFHMLGWPSLVGLAILPTSFPLAKSLSRKFSLAQKSVMAATDIRMALVTEYISSVRSIKYFAWEEAMAARVGEARTIEQKCIWRKNLYAIAITLIGEFIPLLTLFIIFTTFTLGKGEKLTAAVAFTSLSVVETLRQQFKWMSEGTKVFTQSRIACQRIDNYLTTAEVRKPVNGPAYFHKATFRRSASATFKIEDVDIEFQEHNINVVTGPSGSGKSTLLLSLIGETILESGEVYCPQDMAYASQNTWLLNDTIRNNILFFQPLEDVRYQAVINACGLKHDLDCLEAGDSSPVGENGNSLSGGQRQRVALARALYSKCSLLLLDDVLSALDVNTAAHIWEHAFRGELVKDRTIILVTQLDWVLEQVSFVTHLKNGKVLQSGHRYVRSHFIKPIQQLRQYPTPSLPPGSTYTVPRYQSESSSLNSISETIAKVRNERTLFYQYMHLFGGYSYAILVLFLALLCQAILFSATLWLSVWVGAYQKEVMLSTGICIAVYAVILASYSAVSILSNIILQLGAWRAAKKLHSRLFNSIISVPLQWFNTNPVGNVINRFSNDMSSMDYTCVESLRATIDHSFRLILRIGGIGSIMPVFAVPAAIVCAIGLALGEIYTKAQLSTKKMVSASSSPIFSHFTESMGRLHIIRAQQMQALFQDQLARKLRIHVQAQETQFNLNRWIAVRLDASVACLGVMAGLLALYKADSVSVGLVGFSLTNAIGLNSTILGLVRKVNAMEVELNGFQRVREYGDLPSEEIYDVKGHGNDTSSSSVIDDNDIPNGAISGGLAIELRSITARYTSDSIDVLKNINICFHAGERVVIIGRTGSGKSTLALSLLRLLHINSGNIFVDGADISQIPLKRLRRAITLIPQDPVLFSGSVRDNLDPTGLIPREIIERAWDSCKVIIDGLHAVDDSMSSPHLTLDTQIASGGTNLSQSKRQILNIARALARRSPINILDEATASLDKSIDMAIQEVLRRELKEKTVLIIAHRLTSVLDCDRVVVMAEGEVVESGPPKELYNSKGLFWNMVQKSGDLEELNVRLSS